MTSFDADRGSIPDSVVLPPGQAWGRVAAMAAILWVILGIGCFSFGSRWVHSTFGATIQGAFFLSLVFTAGALVVVVALRSWQRRLGETLSDIGWRRPTTRRAIAVGVLFGVLWTAMGYSRGGNPLELSWQRPIMMILGVYIAFAEEAARAFMLTQLHRARVPAILQIAVGGIVMGGYHGLIGLHFSPLYAAFSFIMFAVLSAIYVWGRRSLTPVVIGHSLTHVLGDPELMRSILVGLGYLG